jgi:hypothetical protein
MSDVICTVGVVEVDASNGAELFDRIAMKNMSMSGSEFLKRWDAGEYEGMDWDSVPGLAEVAIALPFAR